jgi:SAM-dependent methyltransferase
MVDDIERASAEFGKALVNKVVPFKFMGRELRFALSHALFSSYDVDAGSKLLLKTVAQRVELERVGSLLDLGCGVGVLGVSVKKRRPEIAVHAVDRDALALEFTADNAAANGITAGEAEGFTVGPAVGLRLLPEREFDLVLSNLPAKAGRQALESVIAGLTRFLSGEGTLAIVVVKTLEELAEQALARAGYRTVYREGTREHAVFHARKTRTIEPDASLAPYRRGEMRTRIRNRTFRLLTVFGLPEFDTLSYATRLLGRLAEETEPGENVLVWNPGQGYLPLLAWEAGSSGTISLAGRDRLSLETAYENCREGGAEPPRLVIRHAPSLFGLDGEYDRLIVCPDADPGVPWYKFFLPSVVSLLKPDGLCLTAAKSTFFGRIDFTTSAVKILKDNRAKGFRAIAFRKER